MLVSRQVSSSQQCWHGILDALDCLACLGRSVSPADGTAAHASLCSACSGSQIAQVLAESSSLLCWLGHWPCCLCGPLLLTSPRLCLVSLVQYHRHPAAWQSACGVRPTIPGTGLCLSRVGTAEACVVLAPSSIAAGQPAIVCVGILSQGTGSGVACCVGCFGSLPQSSLAFCHAAACSNACCTHPRPGASAGGSCARLPGQERAGSPNSRSRWTCCSRTRMQARIPDCVHQMEAVASTRLR